MPQGTSAELIASRWGLTRTALDEIAARSHERAAAATEIGAFAGQLAPVGDVKADEGIRAGSTVADAGRAAHAVRRGRRGDGGQLLADLRWRGGAARSRRRTGLAQLGWTPLARLHSFATAGVDPITMLTAPIPATARVLARAGLRLDEIGAFEVNEAFASVIGAWLAETGADPDRVNPLGGAIALGHPLGGSGARLMTTLVHHLRDRRPSLRVADHVRGRRDGQRHRARAPLTPPIR